MYETTNLIGINMKYLIHNYYYGCVLWIRYMQ